MIHNPSHTKPILPPHPTTCALRQSCAAPLAAQSKAPPSKAAPKHGANSTRSWYTRNQRMAPTHRATAQGHRTPALCDSCPCMLPAVKLTPPSVACLRPDSFAARVRMPPPPPRWFYLLLSTLVYRRAPKPATPPSGSHTHQAPRPSAHTHNCRPLRRGGRRRLFRTRQLNSCPQACLLPLAVHSI